MTVTSARPIFTLLAAFLALVVWQGSAWAQQDDFLARFAGSWSGSGIAQRDLEAAPIKVTCSLAGKAGTDAGSVAGTCRALGLVSRQIGITLRYDPRSKRYTGTYTGSRTGPARLSGRRSADVLNLTITWSKPVNGDTSAQMTIWNAGKGRLDLSITDEAPGGKRVRTTSIALTR